MIIGLVAPSGSWKTQVAKHLETMHGFERMHAGAPIKEMVRTASGMTKEQMRRGMKDTPTMRLGGKSPRDLLEATGHAVHMATPELTAMRLEGRIHKARGMGHSNIVVDGVRSPREAAVIQRLGGMMVRCDNGKEADSSMPMDVMQRAVPSSYTLDTSGPKKSDRHAKADQMLRDCLP